MKRVSRLVNNGFVRGSAVFATLSFVVSVLNYLFNLVVARSFSVPVYGEYSAALSYIALLLVPTGALGMILIKRIGAAASKDRPMLIKAVETWFFLQLKKGWLPLILIATIVASIIIVFGKLSPQSAVSLIAIAALTIIATIYSSGLQAQQRFFQLGSIFVIATIVKILLLIGVVFASPSLIGLYATFLLSEFLMIYLLRKYSFEKSLRASHSVPGLRVLLRYAKGKTFNLPLFSTLGTTALISTDVILAKVFFSAQDAGFYAGLSLLGKIILYLSGPMTTVAFTFFSSKEHFFQQSKVLFATLFGVFLSGMALTIIYAMVPNFIISIIFGAHYLSISPLLPLSALFGLLYSLVVLFTQFYVAQSKLIAVVPTVAAVVQGVSIAIFHQSATQILIVNSVITLLVLCVFVGYFFTSHKRIIGTLLFARRSTNLE